MATKKAKVPTKSELAAMRKRLIKAVKDAEKREIDARKRWDDAQAELSYLEDCVGDAEHDLFEAEEEIVHFDDIVEEAERCGDWSYVVKFKPMKW